MIWDKGQDWRSMEQNGSLEIGLHLYGQVAKVTKWRRKQSFQQMELEQLNIYIEENEPQISHYIQKLPQNVSYF